MDEPNTGQNSSETTHDQHGGSSNPKPPATKAPIRSEDRQWSEKQAMLDYEASRGGPTMVSDNGMLVAKPGCAMFVPGTALGKLSLLGGTEFISTRPGAYAEQYIATYEAYLDREPPTENQKKLYEALIEIYRAEASE